MRARIVGVLLAAGPRRCYVPVGHNGGCGTASRLSWDDVRAALAPLMEDPGRAQMVPRRQAGADPVCVGPVPIF